MLMKGKERRLDFIWKLKLESRLRFFMILLPERRWFIGASRVNESIKK